MKKLLLPLFVSAVLASSSQAALILSNSFEYADGPLVSGSAGSPLGVWTTHSGTANQVDVSAGKVNLTGSESEDVSTVLTNASFPTAISDGTIYASFDLNVSQAPTAAVYFGHFRGIGTGDFRSRVFVAQGTDGKVKLGVVNGSSTSVSYVPLEMDLNVTYKIVVRFVGAAVATVWIDPNSEDNSSNRAIGTDSPANTYAGAYYWSWRQAFGMGVFTVDNLLVGTTFEDVAISGGAPSISPIPDQNIAANSSTGPIPFTVNDVETPAASLVPSADSDNQTLIPDSPANIVFGGAGSDRTVNIIPASGQQGTANIAIIVTDTSGLSATSMVRVVVGAPTIQAVADQTTPVGTPFAPITISVNDNETPGSLSVVPSSSNQSLIQDSGLNVTGSGTTRTLHITPQPGQTGVSEITLTLSDGTHTVTTKFRAAVSPNLGVILSENFDYPDGFLMENSGYRWLVYSPAPASNDCWVASGKLTLSHTNYDDVHAYFNDTVSFSGTSGAILYSSFKVNFSQLPIGSGGGYFAFFKETGNSQFRGRVFAQTNGAAAGKFRLAISNGGFTQQSLPRDLSLDTEYVVVTRFNTVTGIATLWVNPSSPESENVSGVDFASATELFTYAFRQSNGDRVGTLTVDDLAVGTSWSDVVTYIPPTPIPLNIVRNSNGTVTLTWSDPAFKLEESTSLGGGWTRLDSAVSGHNVAATGTKFYRLATP